MRDATTPSGGALGRRALLTGGALGLAGVAGLAAASPADAAGTPYTPFTPEQYGAVGDGSDETTKVQAAIDAAAAAGGGLVILTGRYGWRGTLTVKNGVRLQGPATRQAPAPNAAPSVPGLTALSADAQLRIGDWAASGAGSPSGVSNLYVDGNFVGGATGSVAKTGLVRVAGVDVYLENLFAHRSAGDGIVYDAVQNSTVVGGASTFHVGAALVLDNGAGALAFHAGYYGTSKGGALVTRDTAGENNAYPFGPSQNTWSGTIFEAYEKQAAPIAEPYAYHVRISGTSNIFVNCNFTGGAANNSNTCVLLDDSISQVPSTTTFVSCIWYTRSGFDAVRIVNNSWAFFHGIQYVSDDGTNHAPAFVCVDGGYPHVSIDGEVLLAGVNDGTRTFRVINSGTLLNAFNVKDTGQVFRLRDQQSVSWRHEGDTGSRMYIDRDGAIVWADGNGSAAKGFIRRAVANGGSGIDLVATEATGLVTVFGKAVLTNGVQLAGLLEHGQADLVKLSANSTVTLDASKQHVYRYEWTAASATTFAFTGAVDGRELTVQLFYTAAPTITWPSTVRFAGNAAPAITAGTSTTITFRYDSNRAKWFETSRSVGMKLT